MGNRPLMPIAATTSAIQTPPPVPPLKLFQAGEDDGAAVAFEVPSPTPELLAEIASKSEELENASPQQILHWSVERFAPRFTMATAFGPEGMVLIHMLSEINVATPIFNL